MGDIVITLIGIITLSCGHPTASVPDPCSVMPREMQMYIPDGRFHSEVCMKKDTWIPSHEAFIRVRGARATSKPAWPGAIQCDDDPKPCVLYPVVKQQLSIDGLSSGPGATVTNLRDYEEDIDWSTLFKAQNQTLPRLGGQNRLARMTIDNGTITYAPVHGGNGAIGATLRFPNADANPTTVLATRAGSSFELSIPDSAMIDIINLPRSTALNYAKAHNHYDCDHFKLHFQLAEHPPASDCPKPANAVCDHKENLGATLFCSNTSYP
jgi:hypothetical protein